MGWDEASGRDWHRAWGHHMCLTNTFLVFYYCSLPFFLLILTIPGKGFRITKHTERRRKKGKEQFMVTGRVHMS